MLQLEYAGSHEGKFAYDVKTQSGAFAGIIAEHKDHARVYFSSNATRGSQRKFADIQAALTYIVERRKSKGWRV